jgi:hypothetical protein
MNSEETVVIIAVLIGAAIGITINVFYLLTLQNVLKEVSNENRLVPAANVWLMFIPLFNLIYPFILYPKISDSIRNEYAARGLDAKGDFARQLGIALPILGLSGVIPFIGILASIANLILFIIFWVKMGEFKNELIRTKNMIKTSISNNPNILD